MPPLGLDDLEVAHGIRAWIDSGPVDPDVITASLQGTLHVELLRQLPAARRFGEATLRTATRQLPAGSCRFCVADGWARVHRTTRPSFDAAHRLLLGNPCRACLARRVNAGRRRSAVRVPAAAGQRGRSRRSDSGTLTAGGTAPHDGRPCVVCYAARHGNRDALVAAATPHARVLAPTGRVRLVVHDGQGREANCSCLDCRASRRELYLVANGSRITIDGKPIPVT